MLVTLAIFLVDVHRGQNEWQLKQMLKGIAKDNVCVHGVVKWNDPSTCQISGNVKSSNKRWVNDSENMMKII